MSQSDAQSEDEKYRKALSNYSASFMSDSKWLRLFRAINAAGISLPKVQWSYIDSDHSDWISFPEEHDLSAHRFADGKFQPFEYRWIESIFIPRRYQEIADVGYEEEQDADSVIEALSAAGQFEIAQSEDGITIYGYKK
jgi:hypothetical protein